MVVTFVHWALALYLSPMLSCFHCSNSYVGLPRWRSDKRICPPVQETLEMWVWSLGWEDSGIGNGNPLQFSCLENTMDRGAWWATVHGVAKSQSLSHVQLCDPMDCSPPGSSVLGIFQAGILEWVAFPALGDLPDPGIEPCPLHCRHFFTTEPLVKPSWQISIWKKPSTSLSIREINAD